MKNFSTEIRESFDNKYLKVFFANPDDSRTLQNILGKCKSVRRANVTISDSQSHQGETLTIYPKPMFDISELENEVVGVLDSYYSYRVIIPEQIVTTTKFDDIRAAIIEQLETAINTIYICVAWFTDDILKDILKQKLQNNVDVRVITFDDGINHKNGVDFENIPHISLRAERHGIMHRKYCIIDNHVVICGSYNWTDNAANRNDENILIVQDWQTANQHTREFLSDWAHK